MRRDLLLNLSLSFILIGIGFMLGNFYAGNGGFSRQEKTLTWTAPSMLTEMGGTPPSFMAGILLDAAWKQDATGDIIFPTRVGALHMNKLTTGPEALEHALRIHGDDAPFDGVYIPSYSSGEEQVTVWIFEIHSVYDAIKHLKKINDHIFINHDSGNYGSFYLQDVQVFHLQVDNKNNYYYRKDNKIYWISMATNDPIPLFIRFYEHF